MDEERRAAAPPQGVDLRDLEAARARIALAPPAQAPPGGEQRRERPLDAVATRTDASAAPMMRRARWILATTAASEEELNARLHRLQGGVTVINGSDYAPVLSRVRRTLDLSHAEKDRDPEKSRQERLRAQQMMDGLTEIMAAHQRLATHSGPEFSSMGRALHGAAQQFLGTEFTYRAEATVTVVGLVLDNITPYFIPQNRELLRNAVAAAGRFSDAQIPSTVLTRESVETELGTVQAQFATVRANYRQYRIHQFDTYRNQLAQFASISMSDATRREYERARTQTDAILGRLRDERRAGSVTDEEIGEAARLVRTAEARNAPAALRSAGAPQDLITAAESAMGLISPTLTNRGGQVLDLVFLYLQNKQVLDDAPEVRPGMSQAAQMGMYARRLATMSNAEYTAQVRGEVAAYIRDIRTGAEGAREETRQQAERMGTVLRRGDTLVSQIVTNEEGKCQPLRDAASRMQEAIRQMRTRLADPAQAGLVTQEQFNNMQAAMIYLQRSYEQVLRMPSGTDAQGTARNGAATIIANAIEPMMSTGSSDISQFHAMLFQLYSQSGDAAAQARFVEISNGIRDGSMTLEAARREVAGAAIRDGDAVVARITDPPTAQAARAFLDRIREHPEQASAQDILRARAAIAIANAAVNVIQAGTERHPDIRRTAMGIAGRAFEALGLGYEDAATVQLQLAGQFVQQPAQRDAITNLSANLRRSMQVTELQRRLTPAPGTEPQNMHDAAVAIAGGEEAGQALLSAYFANRQGVLRDLANAGARGEALADLGVPEAQRPAIIAKADQVHERVRALEQGGQLPAGREERMRAIQAIVREVGGADAETVGRLFVYEYQLLSEGMNLSCSRVAGLTATYFTLGNDLDLIGRMQTGRRRVDETLLARPAEFISAYRARIAGSEGAYVSDGDMQTLDALRRTIFGDRERQVPDMQARIGALRGRQRSDAQSTYGDAFYELCTPEGNRQKGLAVLSAADLISRTSDDADRTAIMRLTYLIRDGSITMSQFQERMGIYNAKLQAAGSLRGIAGLGARERQRAALNISSYYDLAAYAYENGQRTNAETILRMAGVYLEAVRARASGGETPATTQTIAWVHGQLGDMNTVADIARRGRRFCEIGVRSTEVVGGMGERWATRGGWRPDVSGLPGSLTQVVLGGQDTEEAAAGRSRTLRTEMDTYRVSVGLANAEGRLDRLARVPARGWEREGRRLEGLAAAEERTAARLTRQADQAESAGRTERAGTLRAQAAERTRRAGQYRNQARVVDRGWMFGVPATGETPAAPGAIETVRLRSREAYAHIGRLEARAAELEAAGDLAGARRVAQESTAIRQEIEGAVAGLEQFNTSIVRVNTPWRERGREELRLGLSVLTAVWSGHDVDEMTGEAREGAPNEERAAALRRGALGSIGAGRQEVERQLGIQRQRDSAVASIRSQRQRADIITRPAEERAAALDRLAEDADRMATEADTAGTADAAQNYRDQAETYRTQARQIRQLGATAEEIRAGGPSDAQPSNIEVDVPTGTAEDGTATTTRRWAFDRQGTLGRYDRALNSASRCDFAAAQGEAGRARGMMGTGQAILGVAREEARLRELRVARLGADTTTNQVDLTSFPLFSIPRYGFTPSAGAGEAAGAPLSFDENSEIYDPNRRISNAGSTFSSIFAVQDGLAAGRDVRGSMLRLASVEENYTSDAEREGFYINMGAGRLEAQRIRERIRPLTYVPTVEDIMRTRGIGRGQAIAERGRMLSASSAERSGARNVAADMERVAQSFERAADASTSAFHLYRGHREYAASARSESADMALLTGLHDFLSSTEAPEGERRKRSAALDSALSSPPEGQLLTGRGLYNYLYQHHPEMLAEAMRAYRSGGAVGGGADALVAGLAAEAETRSGTARRERNDPVWSTTEYLLALGRQQFEAHDSMEDQLGKWRRTGAGIDLMETKAIGAQFYSLADSVAGFLDSPEDFRDMVEGRMNNGFRRQIHLSPVVVNYGTAERRTIGRYGTSGNRVDFLPTLQSLVRMATIREAALTIGGTSLLDFSPVGRRYMFTEYNYDGSPRPYDSWSAEERAYFQRTRATLETAYNILGVRPVSVEDRREAADQLMREAMERNPAWFANADPSTIENMQDSYRRAMPYGLSFERSSQQLALARAGAAQLEQGTGLLRSQMLDVASFRRSGTARVADYAWGYIAQGVGYAVDYGPGLGSAVSMGFGLAGEPAPGTGVVAYGQRYVRETRERPEITTEAMFGREGIAGQLSVLATTMRDVSTGDLGLQGGYSHLGRMAQEYQGSRVGERLTLAGRAEIGLHQRSTLAGVDFVEDTLIGLAMGPYGFAYWGMMGLGGAMDQVHQSWGYQYIGTGRDETSFFRSALGMSEGGAETASKGMFWATIALSVLPVAGEAGVFSRLGTGAQKAYGVAMLGAGTVQGIVGLGQTFDWDAYARANPGASMWSGLASGQVRVRAGASLFAGLGNVVMGPAQILGARALAGRFSPHDSQARIDAAINRGDYAAASRLMRPSFGRAVGGWLMGQHGDDYAAMQDAAHASFTRLREPEQIAMSRLEMSRGQAMPATERIQLADSLSGARRTLETSLGAGAAPGARGRGAPRVDLDAYRPGDATHPLEALVVRARERQASGERLSAEDAAALAFVENPITQQRFVSAEAERLTSNLGLIGAPEAQIPAALRGPLALVQELARSSAQRRAGGAPAAATARDYQAAVQDVAQISLAVTRLRAEAANPASPAGRYVAAISEPMARELAGRGMSAEDARTTAREQSVQAIARETVLRGRVREQVAPLDAAQSVAFSTSERQPPLTGTQRESLVSNAQRVQRWMGGQEPVPPQFHSLVTEGMARIARGEDARRVLTATSDAVRTWENTREQMNMRERRIRMGQEMLSAPGVSFNEGSGRFTIAHGGVELSYSRFSMETARDVVIGAERVRSEGVDAARIFPDNPVMQEAVRRLAQDPRFIEASGQQGGERRSAQLRLAMERVSGMPEAVAREETTLGTTITRMHEMAEGRRARAERLLDFERNPVRLDANVPEAQRAQRTAEAQAQRRTEARELTAQAEAFEGEIVRRMQAAERVGPQLEPQMRTDAGAWGLNEAQAAGALQKARRLSAALENDAALTQLPLADQRFIQRMRMGERTPEALAQAISRRAAMEAGESAMADAVGDAVAARPQMNGEQTVRALTIEEAFNAYRELSMRGTPTEAQVSALKATYNLSDSAIQSFSQWRSMARERVAGEIADLAMRERPAQAAPEPRAARTRELGGERITALEGEARHLEHFDALPPRMLRDMAARRRAMAGEAEATDAPRAATLRRQAAALDAEAQARQARAPATRAEDVARRVEPGQRVTGEELLAVMRQRAARSGEDVWTVGGREADMGTLLRTIEDSVITMAQGGRESDLLIFSGDKSLLNAINNLFGEAWGDIGLSAYREIVRLALAELTRPGEASYFMRPSPKGDETITVVVLRPNRGEQVRSRIDGALRRATERVLNGADSPYAEALGQIRGRVADPARLVSASLNTSRTIRVRRDESGRVTATYPGGENAYIQREGGRREFLTHAATAADDPAFAGPLRKALHVEEAPNRSPAILGRETGLVQEAWGRRSAPRTDSERAIVARTTEVLRANGADAANPTARQLQDAVRTVANERAVMSDTETVRVPSTAFEIRLSVTDPAVLAQIGSRLPETGKGVAEVFNNIFGIRAVNTFLGHDGANAAINFIDGLVLRYANEHNLPIRELGTMKFIIDGGTPEQVQGLYRFINEQIRAQPQASRFGFEVSDRSPVVRLEPGTTGESARTHVSNGHMVVERRGPQRRLPEGWTEAQAKTTDWDGETRRYATANAIISAFNSRMATEPFLRQLLGDQYEALRPIIAIVRARSEIIGSDAIRNFEDLVFALRDSRIGGAQGRILEGAFRSFVVEHGAEFRTRLAEAVPAAPSIRRRAGEEASVVEMRLAAGMGAPALRPQGRPPARGTPRLALVPREGAAAQETRAPGAREGEAAPARPGAAPRMPEARRMEAEVGAIPSARADAMLSGALPEVLRVGRAIDSMVRGDAVLTEAQVRANPEIRRLIERYPEYESAIVQMYTARPEERPLVLREEAGQIIFRRSEAPLEAALKILYPDEATRDRAPGSQTADPVVQTARTLLRAKYGQQMSFEEMGRVDISHFVLLDARMRRGMTEAEAIISVAREIVRGGPEPQGPAPAPTGGPGGGPRLRVLPGGREGETRGGGTEARGRATTTRAEQRPQVQDAPGTQGMMNAGAPQPAREAPGRAPRTLSERRAAREEAERSRQAQSMQETLGDSDSLLDFARRVANDETVTVGRTRVNARELLDRMDPRVQGEVRDLGAMNPQSEFAQASRRQAGTAGDFNFRRYRQAHRQEIDARIQRIQATAEPEAQAQAAAAAGGGGADLMPAIGRPLETGGIRPGDTVAMAGSFVSPSRYHQALGAFRSAEGGQAVAPESAGLVAQIRQRMRTRGISAERAVTDVLEARPPTTREELGTASKELHDIAEAYLSGNAARVRAAQEAYLDLPPAMQEAIIYMITPGSEYHNADAATRLRNVERMGRSIELENAGIIEPISADRLRLLAGIADRMVYDGTATDLSRISPPMNAAEARALGRLALIMSEARRDSPQMRAPPESYITTYFRDRLAPERPAAPPGEGTARPSQPPGARAEEAQQAQRPAPRPLELFGNQAALDNLARFGVSPVVETGGAIRIRSDAGIQYAEFTYQHQNQSYPLRVALPEPRPGEPAYVSQHRARTAVMDAVLGVWERGLLQSAPESTQGARRMSIITRDMMQAEGRRYGFGNPNERAVAQQLARDPAYLAALARGDVTGAMAIAERFSTLAANAQGTRAVVTPGAHGMVDVVNNARQVMAMGDLHGDVYGLVDQYLRNGVLVDTRPDLARSDRSVPAHERYRINPDLPEGTQIVFMGDYIDRGPTSMEAIDFVRQMQADAAHIGSRVHTLRGNHEEAFMRFTRLFSGAPADIVSGIIDGSIDTLSIREVNGVRGLYHDGRLAVGGEAFRQLEQGGFIRPGADTLMLDAELAIGARNLGIAATYRSIEAKYSQAYDRRLASDAAFRAEVDAGRMDKWRFSVAEMERDGTMGFLRGTRGAVVIDGNLFTHGGPMMTPEVRGAGSLGDAAAAMDAAFQRMFGNPNNPWTYAGQIFTGSKPAALMGRAANEGDRTFDYVSQGNWHQTPEFGQFRNAGFRHVYVGHDRAHGNEGVRGFGDHVTNLDVSMSEGYRERGRGFVVIDPMQRNAPVRVEESRAPRNQPDLMGERDPADRPRNITNNRPRMEVLGNDLSRAADLVFAGGRAPPPPEAAPAPRPAPAQESQRAAAPSPDTAAPQVRAPPPEEAAPMFIPRQLEMSGNITPVATLERHLPPATTQRNGLVRGLSRDLYRYLDAPASEVPEMYRQNVADIRANINGGGDRNTAILMMASMLVDTSGLVRPAEPAVMEATAGRISGSKALEAALPRGEAGREVRQVARSLESLANALRDQRMGIDFIQDPAYREALAAIDAVRTPQSEAQRADFIKRWAGYIVTNRGGAGPDTGGPGTRGPGGPGGSGGPQTRTRGPATSTTGTRAQAGWEAVAGLGLDRRTDIVAARRSGASVEDVSPLAAAARRFVREGDAAISNLPQEVQGVIRTLAANEAFATYARGSTERFIAYISRNPRGRMAGGLTRIESARGRIMDSMPVQEGMQAEQRAAANAGPLETVADTTGRRVAPGERQAGAPLLMDSLRPIIAMADGMVGPTRGPGVPALVPTTVAAIAEAPARGGGRGRGRGPGGPAQQRTEAGPRELTPRQQRQVGALTGLEINGRTPWQAVRGGQREAVLDDVMPVYAQAYGRAGLSYHEPRQLIGRMDLIFVARDSEGRAVGFATFSQTPDGLRLGLIGAVPRNTEGRAAVRAMLRSFSQMEGAYGNVSAAVAGILVNEMGAPVVPFAQAQRRMGGSRGGGANAVRDAGVLRERMTAGEFAASPIVQRAMERTGRSATEITFNDIVDAAAHPREDSSGRVTALAEIPNTPEARSNCFALVQMMEGPNGTRIPTIEVKIMVGRPAPEAEAKVIPLPERGRPGGPAPREAGPELAPPAPARRPPYEVGPQPQGATRVRGAGTTPMDVIGMQPNDPYFGTNNTRYNGLFEVNGQRFAEFTLQGVEGQPRVRIPITEEVNATSGAARRQLIEARLAAARENPVTPESPAAPAPPGTSAQAQRPEEMPSAPIPPRTAARAERPAEIPAQRPAFEIGPRPEGATQVRGAGATPMDVIGMQPNDPYFRENNVRYGGVFEADGRRFAEFTLSGVEGAPKVRIYLPEEAALASSGQTRRQYMEQQVGLARTRATAGEAPQAPPPSTEQREAAPAGPRPPPLPAAARERRREAPAELAGRSLRDADVREHENMERRLAGSGNPDPEVARLLPQGEFARPIAGIARALEQMAGREPSAVAPEYRDAVGRINAHPAGAARAEEIARQAQAIFAARGGALGYTARRMVDTYVQGGTTRERAESSIERALLIPSRYGREGFRPQDATDAFMLRIIDDAIQRNPGRPRDVVALEVGRELASATAGIMRRSRPDGATWTRPQDAGEALAYNIAFKRAEASGRTEPSSEDFLFGTLAMGSVLMEIRARGINHLAAECITGLDTLLMYTPPERLHEALATYMRTAAVIAERVPASAISEAEHRSAAQSLFNLASYLQAHGGADPASLFTNQTRTGLMDSFTIGSPADLLACSEAVMHAADIAHEIVQAKRGGMIEPTLRLIFEDLSRMDPDAKSAYLNSISGQFAWSDALGERVSALDAKTGASARKKRMPMLAYMMDPTSAPIMARLDTSAIRNSLSTDTTFREFARFLDNIRNAENDAEGQAWLAVVRENTEFLAMNPEERMRQGISESMEASREAFITSRMRHLNTLYAFHREGRLPEGLLRQITQSLSGQLTTSQFSTTIGRGYMQLVPELRVSDAWVSQNLDMFAEMVTYRRTLGLLAGLASRFPDYVGTAQAFGEALRIFDQALMAHIEGRFADFKFPPEFRRELTAFANAAGLDGEGIFRTWSGEHTFQVSAAGSRYEVHDTGAFDAGFYSGMVRGATACQSPRNLHPVVGGIVGSIAQPWMRQVVIGPPGSGQATYRRWMTLVRGDDGRPILLLQPAYQLPGTPPEVDRAVIAGVRQRYGALGIEVREIRAGVDEHLDEAGRPVNRGYSTFAFRSPFVYLDSNMREINFQGRRAQNGLVTERLGGTVSFPPGSRQSTTR